jgi:hypothetical protein
VLRGLLDSFVVGSGRGLREPGEDASANGAASSD